MAADGDVAVRSPLLGCSRPLCLIAGRGQSVRAEHSRATTSARKETVVFLATTQIEDFDRFLEIFSMRGTEKRQQHGSKCALIFRDPSEEDRVWVIFDWDEQGSQSFVSDPGVPPIMKKEGRNRHIWPPTAAPDSVCEPEGPARLPAPQPETQSPRFDRTAAAKESSR